jgi:hypothetical protein
MGKYAKDKDHGLNFGISLGRTEERYRIQWSEQPIYESIFGPETFQSLHSNVKRSCMVTSVAVQSHTRFIFKFPFQTCHIQFKIRIHYWRINTWKSISWEFIVVIINCMCCYWSYAFLSDISCVHHVLHDFKILGLKLWRWNLPNFPWFSVTSSFFIKRCSWRVRSKMLSRHK